MIKPMKKFYLILMALAAFTANAQVRIATDQGAAHSKSMLEINSTDKGLLIPRLTTAQRTAITATADATADGLLVYDTDLKALYVYSGAAWNAIPNTASISSSSTIAPVISSANGANAILGFNVVDGSISSGKLADGAVTATKLASMSATSGQVLTYNGTAWAPATPAAGGGGGNGVDPDVNLFGTDNGGADNNIALTTPGSTSLSAITDPNSAIGNIAIGPNALAGITTGAGNVAIGAGAGNGTTTGNQNIFIGANVNNDDPTESAIINIGGQLKLGKYNTSDWGLGIGITPITNVGNTIRLQIAEDAKINGNLTVGSLQPVSGSIQVGTLKLVSSGIAVLTDGVKSSISTGGLVLTANHIIILTSNSATVKGALRAEFSNGATSFAIKSHTFGDANTPLASEDGNVSWAIFVKGQP